MVHEENFASLRFFLLKIKRVKNYFCFLNQYNHFDELRIYIFESHKIFSKYRRKSWTVRIENIGFFQWQTYSKPSQKSDCY